MEKDVEATRISGPGDIKDNVLHARARQGWRDAWTNGFVVFTDGVESGLLMLDLYASTSTARVYEIFVLEQFRQRRIGTGLMEVAEAEARKYGAKLLELEAYPLDLTTDLAMLRQWYSMKGFGGTADTRVMTKVLRYEHNE